jgi:hypothetical protein
MTQIRLTGQLFVFFATLSLLACSAKEVDLCTLLTLQEVQELRPSAVSGVLEKRHPNTPNPMMNKKEVKHCVWNDAEGNNVLLLAAGLATKNPLVDINEFIYGDTVRIEPISGVGLSAVAVFSLDDENSNLVKFNTQGKIFSIELYSSFVGDENSKSFNVIKGLAKSALDRLQ